MKTTKIITTLVTLNLVMFLSMAASAKSNNRISGDNEITKNKISAVNTTNSGAATANASETEFSYLRFDVNKYVSGNETTPAPAFTGNYLRFDVNNYMGLNETEVAEMPSMSDFEYLRFNVNDFLFCNSVNELPVNEFEYLRFDSNSFLPANSIETEGVPAS